MNRVAGTGIAVLALLGGVTGAVAHASQRTPLTLGAVYPTANRDVSEAGIEEYRGVQLAVERTNELGGVGGRPVRLASYDAETPDAAVTAVESLHRRHIPVLFGTFNSTLSAPAAAAAARHGMVLWETGAVGLVDETAGAGRNFFRLTSMGQDLGRNAIGFVRDELAPRAQVPRPLRYAVVHVDDVYGRSVAQGALAEIARSNAPLAGTFPYNPQHVDMAALASAIGATRPNVLMVVSYLHDGEELRKATLAAHLPLVASIGTSSSFCAADFGRDLGPGAVGLFASDKPAAVDLRDTVLAPSAREELHWAEREWRRRYHGPMEAHALTGFSGAWALLHHVLPAARTFDARGVQDAAAMVKLPLGALANGSGLDLAPAGAPDAGANRRSLSVIWEWVSEGHRAVVWPPQYATAPVVLAPPA